MTDVHRHSEFSLFDGFGKSKDMVKIAKELGYTSFSVTDHGSINGWIKHYHDSKEAGLKPILGIETYFKVDKDDEGRGYHLCLYVKNKKGYSNINKLLYIAEQQKYYNGIVTFKDLEKYSEGLICSSGCVS